MKRILVTGAAGFIGSACAAELAKQGHFILGIDNFSDYYDVSLKKDRVKEFFSDDMVFVQADILDKEKVLSLCKEHNITEILHLAAQAGVRYSLENPSTYVQTNVQGTTNIFEIAKELEIGKIVFASSSSVYGNSSKEEFSESDDVTNPVSLYAATKVAKEVLARTYYNLYGISSVGLRFFTVYGPWGRPDMSPHIFAHCLVKQKPIPLFNNGKMQRGFTYITDIVSGVVSAVNYSCSGVEIFNLSSNGTVELEEYVSSLAKAFHMSPLIENKPMQKGDVYRTHADISKARKELGYDPKVSIKEGLQAFADWFLEYYD